MRPCKSLLLLLLALLMSGAVSIIPQPAATPVSPVTTPVDPSTVPQPVVIITPTPLPDPSAEYLLPDSATRYLTEADLAGLSHEQLCFARNEIYARHGRIFKTPQLAASFNSKSWYHGTINPDKFDGMKNGKTGRNMSLRIL